MSPPECRTRWDEAPTSTESILWIDGYVWMLRLSFGERPQLPGFLSFPTTPSSQGEVPGNETGSRTKGIVSPFPLLPSPSPYVVVASVITGYSMEVLGQHFPEISNCGRRKAIVVLRPNQSIPSPPLYAVCPRQYYQVTECRGLDILFC